MIPTDMVPYLEDVRAAAVICMLAASAYTDIRRRVLAGRDRHYIAAGAAGCATFLVAENGWQDPLAIFSMFAGITVAFLFWRLGAAAPGDTAILLAASVMLPAYNGIYFVPVIIALLAVPMLCVVMAAGNLALNASQYLMPCGRPPLFAAYPGAGALKRMFCVFWVHGKRPWIKHVLPVSDDGRGSFSFLRITSFGREHWGDVEDGRLVVLCLPVVPFFLAVLVLVVVAAQFVSMRFA